MVGKKAKNTRFPSESRKRPTKLYWAAMNRTTGEIAEHLGKWPSTKRAYREATEWIQDNWSSRDDVIVHVGTRPLSHYPDVATREGFEALPWVEVR